MPMNAEQGRLMLYRAVQNDDSFVECVDFFSAEALRDPHTALDIFIDGVRMYPDGRKVILEVLDMVIERTNGTGWPLAPILEVRLNELNDIYNANGTQENIDQWVAFLARQSKLGLLSFDAAEKYRMIALQRLDKLARQTETEEVQVVVERCSPIERVLQQQFPYELYAVVKSHAELSAKIDDVYKRIAAAEAALPTSRTQSELALSQHLKELAGLKAEMVQMTARVYQSVQRVAAFESGPRTA